MRLELRRHADVGVQVAAIGVERVVDRGEAGMPEALVGHGAKVSGSGGARLPVGYGQVMRDRGAEACVERGPRRGECQET
ncbi:hypothetical protein STRTUCAR8_03201 [Streptomyces turgidiscabies Car8]|uniref:Uncharacterized protein n=1 Tax=Streptomyces turgidiscabies (strain Car8) TaxID=698760 RepID=L7F623_STRT8|nr:hypothetical protein STRTUCAR8_03201 [Streptomyces turgidiscabies Car8]